MPPLFVPDAAVCDIAVSEEDSGREYKTWKCLPAPPGLEPEQFRGKPGRTLHLFLVRHGAFCWSTPKLLVPSLLYVHMQLYCNKIQRYDCAFVEGVEAHDTVSWGLCLLSMQCGHNTRGTCLQGNNTLSSVSAHRNVDSTYSGTMALRNGGAPAYCHAALVI